MVKKIDQQQLKQELTVNENRPIVIEFSASWCGPCRMLKPLIEELAEKLCDKVTFYEADVDEQQELAEQFEVSSVPTLVLIQNGEVKSESIGVRSKDELQSWILRSSHLS